MHDHDQKLKAYEGFLQDRPVHQQDDRMRSTKEIQGIQKNTLEEIPDGKN